jgi:hypothetical protein
VPEADQRGVDAVLEHRAVLDQVQPEARLLTLAAHPRSGQPDRRDQVAMREHCQDLGVDAVGLASERREPLDLLRVGDQDLPAELLEGVAHEPRAGHRLDHPAHPALPSHTLDELAQPVSVRRCRQALDDVALVADQADVQAPATEIQSSVQHEHGPPRPRSPMTRLSVPPGRPSFMAVQSTCLRWLGVTRDISSSDRGRV